MDEDPPFKYESIVIEDDLSLDEKDIDILAGVNAEEAGSRQENVCKDEIDFEMLIDECVSKKTEIRIFSANVHFKLSSNHAWLFLFQNSTKVTNNRSHVINVFKLSKKSQI